MQGSEISTMKYSKIDVLAKLVRKITLLKNVLFSTKLKLSNEYFTIKANLLIELIVI